MTGLRPIDDHCFDRIVEQAKTPVLVLFWQPGCGHCQALSRELESVQEETGERLMVLAMNVQENHLIPAELEIESLPALALYKDGELRRFIGGLGKKDEILKKVFEC